MRSHLPTAHIAAASAALALSLAGAQSLPESKPAGASERVRFARDIQPIFAEKCFGCHGPDEHDRKAGLRLDIEQGLLRRDVRSLLVVPGAPSRSPLMRRVSSSGPDRMPPSGHSPLTAKQLVLVRAWIAQGAKWEGHWAYTALESPHVPSVRNARWARNDLDRFVLARLESAGLAPAPEAPRAALLRRVSLVLTGLPPTPAETAAFLADRSPVAYERVVDRLLSSPRFGERWVWEWLDAARYADTNGYQEDRTRTMWPWRDWVVNALNANMPFDQFTIEQIAGDLLPNATVQQRIATGFNRNHMLNGEGGRIPEESRVEYVWDRVETTGAVWLAQTLVCARCHNHKYDPFTMKDYYSLYAYFNNVPETGAIDRGHSASPVLPLPTPEQSERLASLSKTIGELEREASTHPQDSPARKAVESRLDEARRQQAETNNGVVLAMVMEERREPREAFVMLRGSYDRPGDRVSARTPESLPSPPAGAPANRLGLAQWLVSPANPLTARVTVNRFWQTVFGTGLVKTAEDFGVKGERPSHPELLDWLAFRFSRGGSGAKPWDVKALIRLIVTSAAFRQSSAATRAKLSADPENRLLSRGPRYRLPSFVLRDQALHASGLLVEKLGGPPVKPYQPEGVWEDFSYGKITYARDSGENLYRRSLYTFWRRSVAPTSFFDTASRRVCEVKVARTNTPLQALGLMNDTAYVEAARALAARVMGKEAGAAAQIAAGFRLAACRAPRPAELKVLVSGYERYLRAFRADKEAAARLLAAGEYRAPADLDVAALAALASTMSVVLNLDEVLCIE